MQNPKNILIEFLVPFCCITILLFINHHILNGQAVIKNYSIEKLTVDGKSHELLSNSLTIDPFGFIWFGTNSGLLKYDGSRLYKHYHQAKQKSLPTNKIYKVHSDLQGNIFTWCAGYHLYVMLRNTKEFELVQDYSTNDTILLPNLGPMVTDTTNTTWVGTKDGICACRLHQQSRQVTFKIDCFKTNESPFQELNYKNISSLTLDSFNILWVGTGAEVYRINPYQNTLEKTSYRFGTVRDIFISPKKEVFLLNNHTTPLLKWEPATASFVPIDGYKSQGKRSYFAGAVDNLDNVWISELGFGMQVLQRNENTNEQSQFKATTGIKYHRKPARDHAGNIWWPGEGVYGNLAINKKISSFKEEFRNTSYVTTSLREGNTLWVGTLGGGLLKYDLKLNKYQRFDHIKGDKTTLPDERIYKISRLDSNHLILLSRGYLVVFNSSTGLCQSHYISSGPIRSAIFTEKGIYLTRSGSGLAYFNFKTKEVKFVLTGSDEKSVGYQSRYLHQDLIGNIWLCTLGGGLVKYNPVTGEVQKYLHNPLDPNSICSNTLNTLAVDIYGMWWIGTTEGVSIFDPTNDTFKTLNRSNGLSGDLVENIAFHPDGLIWLTGDSGISKIDPKTMKITSYPEGSGLTNTIYYPRSIYIDDNGIIYLGGNEGLNFFHPNDIGSNQIKPKVWITEIEKEVPHIAAEPIEKTKRIDLAAHEEYVNISFSSNHFTNPEKNEYEYRVLGLEPKWISLGRRSSISLLGLSPGTYTLEINTITSDFIKSAKPAQLEIYVHPYFYQTWLFYLLVATCIGWIVYVVFKNKLVQVNREAEYNQKISNIKMKALRSQMNPHFIFNSLNSIKSFIIDNDAHKAAGYLTKFAQLMRNILNHSKADYITLEDEIEALELYIQLEKIRFKYPFESQINVDPILKLSDIEIQPLLLQPFVENAIWHGLNNLDHSGVLDISIMDLKKSILFEITDNGIGREKAKILKQTSVKKSKSFGIEITLDRLKSKYHDNFNLEIIDIIDNGKPSGTTVRITIPKTTL